MGIKKENTDNTKGQSKKQKKEKATRDAGQNRRLKIWRSRGKASDTDGKGKR